MRFTDKRGKYRRHAVQIFGGWVMVCSLFLWSGMRIECEAKEADEEKEVIAFVTAFQEAYSPEKLDTLADYVDDPESRDFQIDLLRMRETYKCGVQGFENIEVVLSPMSDGRHWLAAVSSDMMVEGFDVGMPGLKTVLVGRNEEGDLKVELYEDPEYSDAFMQEMRELALSDEMVERNNEVAAAYNGLIAEREDMLEWALTTQDTVDKNMGEAIEELFSEEADAEEEKESAGTGSYIVKKGDCLWDIAKEQLGDGMRWGELYEANREVVGGNPDLLYVGIELQMP